MLTAFLLLGYWASWLVPLHFPPWISWHIEAAAFFMVVIAAWAGWLRQRGGAAVMVPLPVWPLAAFFLVAVLQWGSGLMMFGGDVVTVGLYLALCIICLMLGYASQSRLDTANPRADNALVEIAIALVAAAALSVVVAMAQTFELWPSAAWVTRTASLRRPGANMAQPNHLALLLVMAFASTAYLYELRKFGGAAALALAGLLALGLAATESRSGSLAAALLVVWWLAKRSHFQSRLSIPAVFGTVATVVALTYLWPGIHSELQIVGPEGARGVGTRLMIWGQLVEALMLHPLRGWGILQTASAHNTVVHSHPLAEAFSYSHNLLLDLAIWMGLPLAVGFLIPATIWTWNRLRVANALVPWYCVALCIPMAVNAMLEFPFTYAYFLAPVMFAAGALEASVRAGGALRLKQWAAGVLLAGTTGILAWSVAEYFAIEEDFRVVRFQVLQVGRTPDGYTPPDVVLLTQLGGLLDAGRVELRPAMPPQELELLRRVALRYPWSATQFRYALASALNGDGPEALRQLQVIRHLSGEKEYQALKGRIRELGQGKFPQLKTLRLP